MSNNANCVTRVFLPERDLPTNENITFMDEANRAAWIAYPDGGIQNPPEFFRFRNEFESNGTPFRFHISADERFVLYLDGNEIGRGPNRGFAEHWYFQSYKADLTKGPHIFEVVVWRLGDAAAIAQLSVEGGCLLFKAEGNYDKLLTTGIGPWEVTKLEGCYEAGPESDRTVKDKGDAFGVERPAIIRGSGYPTAYSGEWETPRIALPIPNPNPILAEGGLKRKGWVLYPCPLPDQLHDLKSPGTKYGDDITLVPPHSKKILTWDLENYYCAYPEMEVSGGKGATIRWHWAESLRDKDAIKGNRNERKDKWAWNDFVDTFIPDGREKALFTTPWWRAGRWCQIEIETTDEPLTVNRLEIAETVYPAPAECEFDCDDPVYRDIADICIRGLQMCSHEVSMDCPFYEQQMYPGDSRVQFLARSALSSDDRFVRSCIGIYDWSRRSNGLVAMNFPTRGTQESTTYTICWLQMLHDYLKYGSNSEWLKNRIPGMRHSLSGILRLRNADGLLANLPGWSFIDWVIDHDWWGGNPPGVRIGTGESPVINLHFICVLRGAAEIEEAFGEKIFAAAWREKADEISKAVIEKYWDDKRGMIADNIEKTNFSEHSQCLAILGDALPPEMAARVFEGLVTAPDLARMTLYFSCNLFATYEKMGRTDLIRSHLDLWRDCLQKGLKTVQECPDKLNGKAEARSDCHGWGSHPLYFFHHALVGVSAAEPFYKSVKVAPNPAGLKWIKAKTPTPHGSVISNLKFNGDKVSGTIVLPEKLNGTFVWLNKVFPLHSGENDILVKP